MKYVQKNPVPLPASGAFGEVRTTLDAVFDWEYALKRQNLLALFEKGKALNWNANELDWSTDVDMERVMRERVGGNNGMMNQLLNPPRPLSPDESTTLQIHMNSFMLSQFLHGEQGALLLPRRHELRHPEPRLAIDLGVQFAFALMLQLVVVGEVRAGGRVLGDRELVAEITRNFLSYIGAPTGDPP